MHFEMRGELTDRFVLSLSGESDFRFERRWVSDTFLAHKTEK
jgi:hypothetical protein